MNEMPYDRNLRRIVLIPALLCLLVVSACSPAQDNSLHAHQLFTEGLAYEALQNYSRSLELYREVVNEFSEENSNLSARAQIRTARIYKNHLKNPAQAAAAYRTYINKYEDGPNHQEVMLELARLYEDQNQVDNARQVFESFLARHGDSPYRGEVLITLGDLLVNKEKFSEARAIYKKYLSSSSDFADRAAVHLKLARVHEETGQPRKQLEILQSLIRKYPETQEYELALFRITRIHASLNQNKKVQEWGSRYRKEFPNGQYISQIDRLLNGQTLDS